MKIELKATTALGAAALGDACVALLKYMEAEADVANFDGAPLIVDKIRLKLRSDPDDTDPAKDKHDATLTVRLKPGTGKSP